MSKKILAAFGVAAALGVAALPLSTYAAGIKYINGAGTSTATEIYDVAPNETDSKPNETGGVITVRTTIDSTLSITIEGDNDSDIASQTPALTDVKHLVLLTDDTVSGTPTAAQLGKIMNGGNGKGGAKFNVITNNLKGYSVSTVATDLTGLGDIDDQKIPAITAAKAALNDGSASDKKASEWGYKVATEITNKGELSTANKNHDDGKVLLIQDFNGAAAAAGDNLEIVYRGTATENAGDDFTLEFGVHANESQAAGTYQGTLTLTAAANQA